MGLAEKKTAFLGLGANIGDCAATFLAAINELRETPGIWVERVSSFLKTAPVGMVEQPDFLNAAVQITTQLSPWELLETIEQLEREHGRERTIRWGPRTLDIDILLYDDLVINDAKLTLPHPRLPKRLFALEPLCEIAPDARFPDGETAQEKLEKLIILGTI